MASVIKATSQRDGKPRYEVRWRTPDGKHRTKGGFRRRKDAQAYAESVGYNQRRGQTFDPRAGDEMFRDVAQVWLESRTDIKPTTKTSYAGSLSPTRRIDKELGGYPINKLARTDIQDFVNRMVADGYSAGAIHCEYKVIRMVLEQAVIDGKLAHSPAEHVKLPPPRRKGKQTYYGSTLPSEAGEPGEAGEDGRAAGLLGADYRSTVDASFLTAEQVEYLIEATPWPYNVLVHVAVWTGLRSGELAGLQVGDVDLGRNPSISVQRNVYIENNRARYQTPKSRRSRRRVPLTVATVAVLREYLTPAPRLDRPDPAVSASVVSLPARTDAPTPLDAGTPSLNIVAPKRHPRPNDPNAPLFPNAHSAGNSGGGRTAPRHPETTPFDRIAPEGMQRAGQKMLPVEQAALLTVQEAGERLALDWAEPIHHKVYYKNVYRPALLRASLALDADGLRPIPAHTTAHTLRHTYASFCVSAGLHPKQIADYMGHSSTVVTMEVYAHLFEDDHADAMAALGSVSTPRRSNVTPLRGWG